LDRPSVQKLAECCVKRMLATMSTSGLSFSSENEKQEEICHLLVLSVIQPSFGLLKITEMKFQLQDHLKEKGRIWTEQGVLSKTGIRTVDGRYFSGAQCRPDKYGYRLGDDNTARRLKLAQTSSRLKSRVTAGSHKTLQVLTLSASASPFHFDITTSSTTPTPSSPSPSSPSPSSPSPSSPSPSSPSPSSPTPTSTSTLPATSSSSPLNSTFPSSSVTTTTGHSDLHQEIEALRDRVTYLENALQQVLGIVLKLQTQAEKSSS